MTVSRALLFGDPRGIPQLLEAVPRDVVTALVGAEIREQQHDEISRFAESLGVPFLVQPRHSSPSYSQFVERIRELAPDVILVNSYSMLIREDILAVPGFNAINVHGALLPQYRGANPTQWALLNNETETGVTMHFMTEEFDAGDIIATRTVPVRFEDTWVDIAKRQDEATVDMLVEEIPKVLAGTSNRRPQDESMAHHHRRRHPEDGLIEWQQSVLDIYNLVRALVKPHPGAFYLQDDRKVALDEYLYIPQVTRLKYTSPGGAQALSAGNLRLTLLAAEDSRYVERLSRGNSQVPGGLDQLPSDANGLASWLTDIEARNDVVVFAVRRAASEEVVGVCWIDKIDHRGRTAEIRIDLDAPREGYDAYLKDVASLGVQYAFEDLELDQIAVGALRDQPGDGKVYKDIGFTADGVLYRARRAPNPHPSAAAAGVLEAEHERH